jgi:hypothetical protein
VFKPLPPRDPQFAFRAAVASGVLAVVLGGAAYYLYTNFFFADFSLAYKRPVPATEGRMGAVPGPAGTGADTAVTGVIAPVPIPQGEAAAVAPESVVPSRPGAPRSAPARSAPPRSTPMQATPVEPRAPRKAAPARVAVSRRPLAQRRARMRFPPSAYAIRQRRDARAAGNAVSSQRRRAADNGFLPEGISALGLCAPASNQ